MIDSLTVERITKARRAMWNAENPKFKSYWRGVVDTLSEGLDD